MTFPDVVQQCLDTHELVQNFDRLRGTNVSRRGSPLDLAIDDATGRYEADLALFVEFVHEFVWQRVPHA